MSTDDARPAKVHDIWKVGAEWVVYLRVGYFTGPSIEVGRFAARAEAVAVVRAAEAEEQV